MSRSETPYYTLINTINWNVQESDDVANGIVVSQI